MDETSYLGIIVVAFRIQTRETRMDKQTSTGGEPLVEQKKERKVYIPPVLIEWGSIKDLTRGGPIGVPDELGTSFQLREQP